MQLTLSTVALAVFFAAASAAPQPPIYLPPGGLCVPGGELLCLPGTQCARPFDLPFGPYKCVPGGAPSSSTTETGTSSSEQPTATVTSTSSSLSSSETASFSSVTVSVPVLPTPTLSSVTVSVPVFPTPSLSSITVSVPVPTTSSAESVSSTTVVVSTSSVSHHL